MWRRSLLLGALALGVMCPPSHATEKSEPVSVKLVGAFPVAEQGRALRATFEVVAHETAVVTDLKVEGDGWNGRVVDRRAESFAVVPGTLSRFAIEATPADPDQRMTVSWKVDGRTYRRTYDFSPATAKLRREGGACVPAPPEAMSPRRTKALDLAGAPAPVGLRFSGPIGTVDPELSHEAPALPAGAQISRWIRVTGRFVYQYQGANAQPWLGGDYMTVQVIEQDFGGSGSDLELGRGMTDAEGNFDITFPWAELPMDVQPDLYVVFVAANGSMHVCRDGNPTPYYWRTGTAWDFAGSTLDLGGQRPNSESDFPQVHILSNMQRFSRWYDTRIGAVQPYITLKYPVYGERVSFHRLSDETINIIPEDAWDDGTHGHEYGHHFMHAHLPYSSPAYCNGVCDADITEDDCGHCRWCPETGSPTTPWNEALPNWISTVQLTEIAAQYAVYGWQPDMLGSFEYLGYCSDEWNPANNGLSPLTQYTEGFMTALLTDLADATDEVDPHAFAGGKDTLAMGWQPVLDVIFSLPASTYQTFLAAFLLRHPELRERFWRTVANNRYDFDTAVPSPPANFHSTSHTAGVASGDATPTFSWTRAADDASGPAGYSIRFGASALLPDAVTECGDVTTWTAPHLNPGSYEVTIRTVDRSGRWGSGFSTWGTLVIREATPANLVPYTYTGWDHPVIPRADGDATFLNMATPTAVLPGNSAATWWNASIKNAGEETTGINWLLRSWVDGEPGGSVACTPTPAGGIKLALNQGPVTVRGGRHTFAARADDDEEISETVETDNGWAHQWIWSPHTLVSGTGVTRAAPPERSGGWEDLPDASSAWYNCDGLRVTNGTGPFWRAVYVRVDNTLVDYDCRLHNVATGAEDGFGSYSAYSRRPGGCIDAVLYNREDLPFVTQYDVGIVNTSGGEANYYAKLVGASDIHDGDSVAVSLPASEMLALREFELAVADTGWYQAKVTITSGFGPVYLAWYDEGLIKVALENATQLDVASSTSDPARLDLHLGGAGAYALAIYRDPKDGTAALTVRLEFEKMKPDYEPTTLPRWYAPLVPRPDAAGSPGIVNLPDTLHGDDASTYFNFLEWNSSHGGQASSVYNHLCVDGVSLWGVTLTVPGPLAAAAYNGTTGRSIAGGRHTLSLRIDPLGAREEVSETNNGWGEQWVWAPTTLTTSVAQARAAPPDATGGWDEVTAAPYGLWYDCDGLRVQEWAPSGHSYYWGAYAVMPGDTSDVDVRLHETAAGAQAGFRTNLVRSTWGPGQSDYCLVNFNRTAFRAFDVGVLRVGDGEQAYVAQAARSVFRATDPDGVFGPFGMSVNAFVAVHEFWLDAGAWDVILANVSGAVDWGMSIHDGARTYHTKNTTLEAGLAMTGGAGEGERLRVTVLAAGYYAVVVWKTSSADRSLVGNYTLEVRPSTVDVPGGEPARTALAGAWPNPFQSGATVAFELAAEGEVSLEVYDLHGARVRTLASGRWPAGRHEVRWDGRGDLPAAPGIYFVRFRAGGVSGTRRVVKLE